MIPLGVLASRRPASGVSAEFVSVSRPTSGTLVRTYSGIAIGDAASDRNVIIICHARGQDIDSATIGGVSATRHASFTDDNVRIAIFSAVVASGTTADVVVTHVGNPTASLVGVYTAYGTLTYNTHATQGGGRNLALTAPADALIIAGLSSTQGFYPGDWSMGAIQDYHQFDEFVHLVGLGGMDQPTAGAWTLTLTTNITSYANHAYMAVAFTLT